MISERIAEILKMPGVRAEAEALAEVVGGVAEPSFGGGFHVSTHLSIAKCHTTLHQADLVVEFTHRISDHYIIKLDGLISSIVGIPNIQPALRMAA